MRAYVIALSFALAGAAAAERHGVYKPKSGPAVEWSVNANHALIWGGSPYIPRGLRIGCTLEEVRRAKTAGFADVVVEMPVTANPPNDVFAEMDKLGLRYMVAIESLAPAASGVSVEPQGYRVDDVTGPQTADFPLPGCKKALAVLAVKRDSSIDWTKTVEVVDGRFSLELAPPSEIARVLLVYPLMDGIALADYWDEFDKRRDDLLTMLRKANFGPGFRGLVNPLGRTVKLQPTPERFVPSSQYFRNELRAYLQKEYRSSETAQKAWSMSSSDIDSIDDMTRLVPLWSGRRGISQMWDPTTGKLYVCDSKYSRAWRDIDTVTQRTAIRRYRALTAAIQTVVNVPVVQEWAGWNAPYSDDGEGLTGLGVVVTGKTTNEWIDGASRPAGAVLGWQSPAWLVATDLRLDGATNLAAALDDLTAIGSRGWFVRSGNPAFLKLAADEAIRTREDVSPSEWTPRFLPFPESAWNPAAAQRLPGGVWWLPSPAAGNRADLGTQFSAYRCDSPKGPFFVLWTGGPAGRVKLDMADPKSAVFETLDGGDRQPKLIKGGVEVLLNSDPLIIRNVSDIPVPQPALNETLVRCQAIIDMFEDGHGDVAQEKFLFKDLVKGYDANPGGSFDMLRKVYWKLNHRVGRLLWFEAEKITSTNFSGSAEIPGCSDGMALTLDIPVPTTTDPYHAGFSFPVSGEGELEVWVAARIPQGALRDVRMIVAGETLTCQGEPVSVYGAGFAWYKFGTTVLKGPSSSLRIEVTPREGVDLAIDTIYLSRGAFRPNGATMPDGIDYTKVKKPKRGK